MVSEALLIEALIVKARVIEAAKSFVLVETMALVVAIVLIVVVASVAESLADRVLVSEGPETLGLVGISIVGV